MPIYPRGKSFMVSVGSGKDRLRETCNTLSEAQAVEKQLSAQRAAKKLAILQAAERGDASRTLQDAYERAYREVWRGSKGERTTLINAKQMIALIGPNTPVIEINSDLISKTLDELDDAGNTGATINKKLATLNVMLKTAMEKGWLKTVPFTKRRKEASQRIFWYTEEEEQKMIEGCKHLGLLELADFIQFAIDTGFRRTELLKLKVSDFYNGTVQLHRGQTKNNDGRTIPATDLVASICSKAAKNNQIRVFEGLTETSLRTQWTILREYLGKTDDPKYIVHVLRHSCATRLAIGGASAPQIMAWMGHKAIQTSMRYIHLTTQHLDSVKVLLTRTTARPKLSLVSARPPHQNVI